MINYAPYPYPQYQYIQPTIQQPVQQPSLICEWVQNKQAAASAQTPLGATGIYMDISEPLVYKKEMGMDGKPLPMETYRLVRENEVAPVQAEDLKRYVREDEISEIITNRIEDIVKEELDRRLSELSFKPTRKAKASAED